MKVFFTIGFQIAVIVCLMAQNHRIINVIPYPEKVRSLEGYFLISNGTGIIVNTERESVHKIAAVLIDKLNTAGGFNFKLREKSGASINSIVFELIYLDLNIPREGYYLKVDSDTVLIQAHSEAGLFYGLQTLLQLLPPEIESRSKVNSDWKIPAVEIYDEPRFEYRGLHLDVSRHFMPVSFIKKHIDNMAMHKLNMFHWHLTDDQGWRIEIKKYPLLTQTGAWRKETLTGHQYVRPLQFDGKPYGGYYTQEEVKEVVKYAAERYITIIPEIDMPGHATAAIASYPYLGMRNDTIEVATRWGVFANLYNVKDTTFKFLEEVLSEVMELFPSPYIHIGGDEARKEQWEQSEVIQSKIRELGLNNTKELQSYFIQRIEKFVNSRGRIIIGWDEILEGGLAPNAIVMSWQGEEGGIHAAQLKHKVIMTPGSSLYFDFYQGNSNDEPLAIGGYIPLSRIYSYEPVSFELQNKEGAKYIIGAQANVWSEYMKDERDVEYMVFPRIAALSEVLWTGRANKNWNRFVKSIPILFSRYNYRDIHYSNSAFNVLFTPIYDTTSNSLKFTLTNELAYPEIRYTVNNKNVGKAYTSELKINKDVLIKGRVYKDGQPIGRECHQKVNFHKAFGARIRYTSSYDTSAFVTNDWTLVDGITGDAKNMYGDIWQRFKSDLNILMGLNEIKKIGSIKSSFVQISGYAYASPVSFEIELSLDGKNFKSIPFVTETFSSPANASIVSYRLNLKSTAKARYIRFIAKNPMFKLNEITGKRVPAVLMADEIIVE